MISCLRATPTACLYLFSFGKKKIKIPAKALPTTSVKKTLTIFLAICTKSIVRGRGIDFAQNEK
jgi:hypothetical protein